MKTTTLLTAVLLTACTTTGGALAAPATPYYYDDGVRRQLTPVPELIAEVGQGADSAVKVELPTAEVVHTAGGTTLYRAPVSVAAQTLSKLKAAKARVSPVYREGNSPAGRLMALPGGVVVNFKADWTEAQITAWAAQRALVLETHLAITGNWYVVATAPGEVAITTANSIQESGAVLSASPNWWKAAVTK